MGESFRNSSDYQHSLQDATGAITYDYSAWLQEGIGQNLPQSATLPRLTSLDFTTNGKDKDNGKRPHCLVLPETTAQLAAVMSHCAARGWRVLPCGHGTKLDWGGLVQSADILISTTRLNQIVEHCVGDLTVTAAAGVSFVDLQQTLGAAGQFWAIDPTHSHAATLGGILATADTNGLRQRFNSVRDMVLGIEFVRADGAISHAGGRVVKNVAGYDLMKLLTGSYGTLGIITEATLRLYPLLGAAKTLLITGSWQSLAELRRLVARSGLNPVVMALVNQQMVEVLQDAPSGNLASITDQNTTGDTTGGMVVQFAGLASSITQQRDQLAQLAKAHDTVTALTESLQEAIWQPDESTNQRPDGIWCKVGLLPEQISTTMQQWANLFGSAGYRALVNSGSGLGTLYITADFVKHHEPTVITQLLQQARTQTESAEGFLTILRAPAGYKQAVEPWGYGESMAMMEQIRQKFDPQGLLSYGRLSQLV